MSDSLANHSVNMIRPTLTGIPANAPPEGFSVRAYQPGDEAHWVAIHELADKWNTVTLATWEREFGFAPEELGRRQLFLCHEGQVIGTASAWYDGDYHGRPFGRVHWVAIVPEYHGRGLGKPLMATVLQRLVELGHDAAYLVTSTARVPAISLYLWCGFTPELRTAQDRDHWEVLRGRIPALDRHLP